MYQTILRLSVMSLCFSAAVAAQAVRVVVLHDNDTHSQLYPFGPQDKLGGMARRATLIKQIRATNQNVLVFNGGDVFVGSTSFNKFFGYPELEIMEGLYDAMALGNHELDLGTDLLAGVLSGSLASGAAIEMPVLCANIDLSTKPALAPWISPSIIKTVGSVKIGIFAVLTQDPIYYSLDVALLMKDPIVAAATQAAALEQAGCDAVICLSHNGLLFDQYVLSMVPGIDVILSGHSHDVFAAQEVNGKILAQAGEGGLHLSELELSIAPNTAKPVSLVRHTLHEIDSSLRQDPAVLKVLNTLRPQIVQDPRYGPMLTRNIGHADWHHSKTWSTASSHRDTPLGNLVTDAVRAAVEDNDLAVDCVLAANGYLGHDLYAGKVTGDDLLRCLPYGFDPESGLGFKIKMVRLYGLQILAGLEFSVSQVEYTHDLCLEVSGLEFAYDSGNAPMSRVDVASVKVGGNPIDPYGLYWVAMSEQLATFLGILGLTPVAEIETDILEYVAVRDFIRDLGHLRYRSTGRIVDTH